MSATRDELAEQVAALRAKAEEAGLVEGDPWASLDTKWKGPDVELETLTILGDETLAAVRQAFVEGKLDHELILEVIELAKVLLPTALAGAA